MKCAIILFLAFFSVNTFANSSVVYYPSKNPVPFSTATQVGNIVYLSGVIGFTKEGTIPSKFNEEVTQLMENLRGSAGRAGIELEDLFKCTVMLGDMALYDEFNKIYITYFNKGKYPSRSAFGANGLAYSALIELECWGYKEDVMDKAQ